MSKEGLPSGPRDQDDALGGGRKFIDLNEAADLLDITPNKLAQLRAEGGIHGYRSGTTWKFKMDEILRFAGEHNILVPPLTKETAPHDSRLSIDEDDWRRLSLPEDTEIITVDDSENDDDLSLSPPDDDESPLADSDLYLPPPDKDTFSSSLEDEDDDNFLLPLLPPTDEKDQMQKDENFLLNRNEEKVLSSTTQRDISVSPVHPEQTWEEMQPEHSEGLREKIRRSLGLLFVKKPTEVFKMAKKSGEKAFDRLEERLGPAPWGNSVFSRHLQMSGNALRFGSPETPNPVDEEHLRGKTISAVIAQLREIDPDAGNMEQALQSYNTCAASFQEFAEAMDPARSPLRREEEAILADTMLINVLKKVDVMLGVYEGYIRPDMPGKVDKTLEQKVIGERLAWVIEALEEVTNTRLWLLLWSKKSHAHRAGIGGVEQKNERQNTVYAYLDRALKLQMQLDLVRKNRWTSEKAQSIESKPAPRLQALRRGTEARLSVRHALWKLLAAGVLLGGAAWWTLGPEDSGQKGEPKERDKTGEVKNDEKDKISPPATKQLPASPKDGAWREEIPKEK